MPAFNPLKLDGIVDGLLTRIHKVIAAVLPDFIEKDPKDPAVCTQIVRVADTILVKQYPEARSVPKDTRQRIIRKVLEIMLDEILLPEMA
jgi:hypothetical protein